MSEYPEIIKANGEREPFKPEKLRSSLERAGAEADLIDHVAQEITDELEPGMTTGFIYKRAFELLNNARKQAAVRYSLRPAIMALGPTGFPFEEFVARLFEARGYTTETNVTLAGNCVEHEVDVLAYNDSELHMMEVKFHNERGIKTDTKDALYVRARYDDLAGISYSQYNNGELDQAWLVTNTKFSSPAMQYGECAGLKMIGWNYPAGESIETLIEQSRLQPVTCLTSISENIKQELLKEEVVLCNAVHNQDDLLQRHGLSEEEIRAVKDEAASICAVQE